MIREQNYKTRSGHERKIQGKDFLSLMDFSREEISHILNVSYEFKMKLANREPHEYLRGKTIALVFEKASTRTRTSFQAAIAHLGPEFLHEARRDAASGGTDQRHGPVIDRYCDALVMRTFGQDRLEEFARYMKNPVINALSDLTHPCQGLADLLTIREKKGFQGIEDGIHRGYLQRPSLSHDCWRHHGL